MPQTSMMGWGGFKRNWGVLTIVFVAIVGTWIIARTGRPSDPQQQTYVFEQARDPSFVPGGAKCGTASLAKAPANAKGDALRQHCGEAAENHRLATNDLIQQTRAADAAQAQSRLGRDATWLSYLQTIGGFLTLLAAIAAAVGAREAAQAARDTLNHARDTSAMELRPYLDFSDVRIHNRNGMSELVVNIENFGKIPATITCLESGNAEVPLVGKFARPAIRDARFDARSVAPGHKVESRHRSLLRQTVKSKVALGQARLVFRLRITYVAFGSSVEDRIERTWLITKEHLTGERTLTRVHAKRHLLDDRSAP